jgi:hypothetical protein
MEKGRLRGAFQTRSKSTIGALSKQQAFPSQKLWFMLRRAIETPAVEVLLVKKRLAPVCPYQSVMGRMGFGLVLISYQVQGHPGDWRCHQAVD